MSINRTKATEKPVVRNNPFVFAERGGALLLWLIVLCFFNPAAAAETPAQLFQQHCAACHGETRLGVTGPALLPQSLHRLRKTEALKVISQGRPATQMLPFSGKLTPGQIQSLVDYIYTPPAVVPDWTEADIKASHVVYFPQLVSGDASSAKPVYDADPLNIFLVVEAGDHHVTVLDGDKLEPIHRFKSRYALHGGPKFTSDGRFVYFASRDGWISKFDMYKLKTVAEVRAGINTRNIAVSADDRTVLVGNYLPHTLVLLNADDLSLIKVIPVQDDFGNSSRVSAVYTAPPRESFVVALKDLPQMWEIFYSDHPPKVFNGAVHDFHMAEGLAEKGLYPIKKHKLDGILDDFFFDQSYNNVIGASRESGKGQVFNLITGQKIAELDLDGMPHLGSGITWKRGDATVMATPNLKKSIVSVFDTSDWRLLKQINTLGPGFFARSHENSPYFWVDVFFGPNRDAVHVIDKQSLKIIKTLRPAPGKTAAHVEFTRDGKYALLSIWDMDGAIVVYDAKTLQEIKRIPMKKPVGKYNVYNKITRSEGTSH